MMLTLANGLPRNKRIITMDIIGINTATLMLIGAVAVGLGTLMQASEILFSAVKWVGVAYLLWLAWQMWFTHPGEASAKHPQTKQKTSGKPYTPLQAFKRCWLVAISNPKGILFFTAFLPQFISLDLPQTPQYLLLAFLSVAIDTSFMIGYALGGVQAARLLTSNNLQRMNRCSAIVMVCMAGGLALYRKAS